MNLEDKAREYAEGKSSASVFRDAHIRDFKAGYNQALKDTRFDEMLEGLKEALKFSKMKGNETMVNYFENLIKQATDL